MEMNWIYAAVLKAINEPVYVRDRERRLTYINPAAERVTGWSLSEALGKKCYEIFGDKEQACRNACFPEEAINQGRSITHHEGVLKTRLGESKEVRASASPLFEDGGPEEAGPVGAVIVFEDITQLKEAEEALKDSENRFRILSQAAFEGIVIHDRGKIVDANRTFAVMFGYDLDEIIGMDVLDLTAPESRDMVRDNMLSGSEGPYEGVALRKDGSTFFSEVQGRAIPYRGGTVRVSAVRDITSRRQSEEALRRTKEEMETIIDSVPALIGHKDIEGRYVRINRAYADAIDRPRETVIGKSDFELTSNRDLARRYWQDDREVMESGVPKRDIIQPFLLDESKWLQTDKIPYRDERGHIQGVIGFGIDISARIQAEKALKESEEAYRSLVENVPIAVYRTTRGPKGKFLMANSAFLRIFGLDSEEALKGISVADLYFHPAERKTFSDRLLGLGGLSGIEVRLKRKDGTPLWGAVSARVKYDEHGNAAWFDCTLQDITAQKEAQEENARLEGQLRQSQKLEAIGTLSGGIAHDFNNILGAIIGYTELSVLQVPEGGGIRRHLQEVLRAANRARDLVKQILTFSRQSDGEPKILNPALIVQEVLKMLRSSLPTTIRIEQEVDREAGFVLADPTHVHQILMNLCTNAAHAMREKGGVLGLRFRKIDIERTQARMHPDLRPGSYLEITVSDTGHGMDEAVMQRIFDPYFSTKNPEEGTGLGLAVVHGIVKTYKGAIEVESRPGEGTTFRVYLPRVKAAESPEAAEKGHLPKGKETVLFVDDEEPLVRMAKELLDRLGYSVTARTSSIEALEAFRSDPLRYDVVITDQTMPNMAGLQLAKEILRIRPGMPIILCTGFSEAVDEGKADGLGIAAFVMKPVAMREMANTIRKVLDKPSE